MTAKVCLDATKSARFCIPVQSNRDFDRILFALSAFCRCPRRANDRSWPQSRRDPGKCGVWDATLAAPAVETCAFLRRFGEVEGGAADILRRYR
jgi:hypothetical protein